MTRDYMTESQYFLSSNQIAREGSQVRVEGAEGDPSKLHSNYGSRISLIIDRIKVLLLSYHSVHRL